MMECLQVAKRAQPSVLLFENVPGFTRIDAMSGGITPCAFLEGKLEECGYAVVTMELNLSLFVECDRSRTTHSVTGL